MENTELIKALRICANQTCCDNCPRYDIDHTQDAQRCCIQLINDAADAFEADEQRIKELEAQLPKEGEWEKAKPKGIVSYSDGYAECSNCHDTIWLGWKMHYCPNCGAKMRGEQE